MGVAHCIHYKQLFTFEYMYKPIFYRTWSFRQHIKHVNTGYSFECVIHGTSLQRTILRRMSYTAMLPNFPQILTLRFLFVTLAICLEPALAVASIARSLHR